MRKFFPYPWYLSLWFLWFVTSVIYVGVQFLSEPAGVDFITGTFWGYIHGFLGLFVPFGVWNGNSVAHTLAGVGSVVIVLWLIVMMFGDVVLRRLGVVSRRGKFFSSLLVLLLLTMCVDLILYKGHWNSWTWFVSAENIIW